MVVWNNGHVYNKDIHNFKTMFKGSNKYLWGLEDLGKNEYGVQKLFMMGEKTLVK